MAASHSCQMPNVPAPTRATSAFARWPGPLLPAELPLKTVVRPAAQISGAPLNTLYQTALALKNQGDCAEPVPVGPSRTMP